MGATQLASFDIHTRFYLPSHSILFHSILLYHDRLESWNLYFLQPSYLQRYADAVAREGVPLHSCFDFFDGKIACICTPVLNERVV